MTAYFPRLDGSSSFKEIPVWPVISPKLLLSSFQETSHENE